MHVTGKLSYEQAELALYRAARNAFVAERKRLAGELKASGDKQGAAQLAKLTRPSASAWAVNQLWWQQRDRCAQLFATAARVRTGDTSALAPYRELLLELREQASSLLMAAGQPTSEQTIRNVQTNLAALAAKDSFDPDPEGVLRGDREPPGFESMQGMMIAASSSPRSTPSKASLAASATQGARAKQGEQQRLEQERLQEQRQREAQRVLEEQRRLAERQRQEQERARRAEVRRRLQRELETARRERDACAARTERLQSELSSAEQQLTQARARLSQVEAQIAALPEESIGNLEGGRSADR